MEHFTVLDDDWDIEEKAVAALHEWGLPGVPLSHPMHLLSGGEKTKVFWQELLYIHRLLF